MTFRIPSREEGAALELHTENADYFRAELRHRGLEAQGLISAYQSFGLAEYFGQMAKDWRGWAGERTWASFEGELRLCATADRAGHVTLVVELHGGSFPKWRAEATLVLEAGQLDGLASEAARFEVVAISAT